MAILDRPRFILDHTRLSPVPHAPEIVLHVANEATGLWQTTEEQLGEIGLPPPYWAFAWAGGQALARYVLDHPGVVAARAVIDFASGSGLAAIAAARAGAGTVEASDIDAFALAAIELNATANRVTLVARGEDIVGTDDGWDVVLAGDVFYERPLAERVLPWFKNMHRRGALVLVGDPGRAYLPKDSLRRLAEYEVPMTGALEDSEIRRTAVYALV
jgi:predicted nicotinamide N-methyase